MRRDVIKMAKMSEFFGMKIYMWPDDHEDPHFHVYYQKRKVASYNVLKRDLTVKRGGKGKKKGYLLPASERKIVREWAEAHRQELFENWRRLKEGLPVRDIRAPSRKSADWGYDYRVWN